MNVSFISEIGHKIFVPLANLVYNTLLREDKLWNNFVVSIYLRARASNTSCLPLQGFVVGPMKQSGGPSKSKMWSLSFSSFLLVDNASTFRD